MPLATPPHCVLVVEPEPLTRFGICRVISLHPLLRVTAEAGNARTARQLCVERKPDLIVLEVLLPNGDGVELLVEFRRIVPEARLLVISQCADSFSVQRAFRAGARAYISKAEEPSELLAALERVITGGIYVSTGVAHLLADQQGIAGIKQMHTLSNRELHIFRRLGRKQGPTAIAGELGVSLKTVETYQRRIIQKLHLSDGRQLRNAAERWANGAGATTRTAAGIGVHGHRRRASTAK